MTVYNFQVVSRQAKKRFTSCTVCGKPGVRQQKFWQTVNPFNKNDLGLPKTVPEIEQELKSAVEAWTPTTHARCGDS